MRKKLTQVHRWTKVDDVRAASRSPPPPSRSPCVIETLAMLDALRNPTVYS